MAEAERDDAKNGLSFHTGERRMKPLVRYGAGKGPAQPAKKKTVILYVEDDENNREVAMLRLANDYNLLLASGSQEACSILATRGAEIEAILMDIELQGSELDGIMLTKLIRGNLHQLDLPAYTKNVPKLDIPIFFVTAYGDRYSEEKLRLAGGNKTVRKPVDFAQLTLALTRIRLEQRHTTKIEPKDMAKAVAPAPAPETGRLSQRTLQSVSQRMMRPGNKSLILYVEDDEESRNIAVLRLQSEYELLVASTSEEACSILATRGADIEAILMDIELQGSEMDGIMLTKLIRGTIDKNLVPPYARRVPQMQIPIIFVTAYSARYKEDALIKVGGSLMIKKPVNFISLKMAITELKLRQNKEWITQMKTSR